MFWLNPFALFAFAVAGAPILIHILIHRRAQPFAFPTLRFLRPTRLAAIRRRLLEDLALLAVRIALLTAAVAALAGPLWITGARRQAWDRRIVRAIVTDAIGAASQQVAQAEPLRQETFATGSLADGVRRAVIWLDNAPPARREIVMASTFPIGSITQADLAAIPADVGVRFERTGTLPERRTVPAGRVLTPTAVLAREVTLAGNQTAVRDVAGGGEAMTWPLEVVSSNDEKLAIAAAVAAVLSQRVWAAPPERRARVVLASAAAAVSNDLAGASPIQQPWMATAVARIAADADFRAAAAHIATGLSDARFVSPPWERLGSAADGRPLAAAAGAANGLVVASAAPASDVATPVLLRSIANAIAAVPDLRQAETVAIADTALQRWARPPAPVTSPRPGTVEGDDRRWLWLLALCLLVAEGWIRRARSADATQVDLGERTRVA